MTNKVGKRAKLRRFLRKARDFYVESMVNLDVKVGDHGSVGCAAAPPLSMPPPMFGANWTKDHDFVKNDDGLNDRRLYRSASERIPCSKAEFERGHSVSGYNGVGRSYSMVGLGMVVTIEEDLCYDFDEEINVNNESLFQRSRSYAVCRRN